MGNKQSVKKPIDDNTSSSFNNSNNFNDYHNKTIKLNKRRTNLIKAKKILRRRFDKIKTVEDLLKNTPNKKETRKMIKLKLLEIMKLLKKENKNITFCKRFYNKINRLEKENDAVNIDKQLVLLYKCLQKKTLSKDEKLQKKMKQFSRRKYIKNNQIDLK